MSEEQVTHIGPSSPTIGKLALAMSKVQAIIEPAKKTHENPFFKSWYADLSAIWETIRKALTENELSVIQTTKLREHSLSLVTILAHSSGEYICGEYPINPVKHDPQSIGSAITYARRYALSAMVGASAEDDDGNAASHSTNGASHQPVVEQQARQTQPQYHEQYQEQAPLRPAPPQGQYPPIDPSQYQWRLHLPFKVIGPDGIDMGERLRATVKAHKFRFHKEVGEDGKPTGYWYGNGAIPPSLEQYHRPLAEASPQEDGPDDGDIPF